MNSYLKWNETTITGFSEENINSLYNEGYAFGRPNKGYMNQTRSMRIDLSKFELSSENRRVLRKTENLKLEIKDIPYSEYTWEIGKLAKDFYTKKFGDGTFSANKVKELLTTEHNFNKLFVYSTDEKETGYAICFESNEIFHYSYPFYNLDADKNTGMSMMLHAIEYAKEQNKKYIYLGSAQRPGDTYKLQFKGLEWFDGETWSEDLDELKNILK
ncbi:hypothetical protein HOF40_00720 [Candidatus Parcubacteria bacterium]|jgi:leucyl-tRNA---protein transferase|nr:hypothetical protein [Candidatus Parcubacteria bacterium]MBT3948593.1 hypothetical protein [Candidatus Parcubacteria bacterium]